MFSRKEALELVNEELGDSKRFLHSVRVGKYMEALAKRCSEDQELWHIVGVCHDFDYDKTKDNWSKHGVLTSEYLLNRLPEEALNAIASHDHRTGIKSDTLLAIGLRAADSLDAMRSKISFENLQSILLQPDMLSVLHNELADSAYLLDNIREFSNRTNMDVKELISLIDEAT